jgi:hypothetical protein
MKHKVLIISLIVVAILGTASGWVCPIVVKKNVPNNDPSVLSADEQMGLQLSFIKQYPQGTITQALIPKVYEVAWTGENGTRNVSMNVGGVWLLIASVPSQ